MAEALTLGCPVLAADIPALRAAGGETPEFIDPLDLPEWLEAILAYAHPAEDGPDRRGAQLGRLAAWQPRAWADHFAEVDDFLEEIGA